MDIKIDNVAAVNLINNKASVNEKKNSTVKIFSEGGNSFTLNFKVEDVESIEKIHAALDLAKDFLDK